MAPFIIIDLSKFSFPEVITNTESISAAMTGNTDFPSPPIDLKTIDDALEGIKIYNKQKEFLSKADRIDRDNKVSILLGMLKRNGQYVVMLFPDNELKQLSSGYPSAKKASRLSGPPSSPSDVRARNGKLEGEIIVNCKKYRGTRSLNIKIVNTETKAERIVNSTSSVGIHITDLVAGIKYEVSVQAVGAKGNSDWSSPVFITVT